MAQNIPRQEKIVVGVTAALAVKPGIHPDHVRLLLHAADRVHRKGGLLERPGQFPSDANLELRLHEQAARYLRAGPSWLERTFPFWVAGLLDRLVLVSCPGRRCCYRSSDWCCRSWSGDIAVASRASMHIDLVLEQLDRRYAALVAASDEPSPGLLRARSGAG